ncbi:hypothetical protein Val02_70320 [Virgisporangium aliadipatigenens]|uniref:non-specific serine/threonine protein kinase n=1 Tax=Virgisporangium aliadipatigenens TaxID=741659 RepID=A0A8J3YRJ4_9ACTN|nr:serine/threonine-protein kinase [Virgisporangium aliadipatigenens]GIJ50146.1 hypothetical protein Val02_70320 [Virgisporangium aliadipatigenens]
MIEQWPAEGDLLNRRYRLLEAIGSGGMATVWRARDESLERLVAVKVLNADLAVNPRVRELVRREARTAAQLTHPQATPVYDYGEAFAPSGRPAAFVVMQLLDGTPLDERLAAGPLRWTEAAQIGEQVARVLAGTHTRGLIHGDIAPSNIVLTSEGVRVIDFGIAETLVEAGRPGIGGLFGTPPYMAPERLAGAPTRLASDVYSLGALLFEMIGGRPPYPTLTWENAAEVRRREPTPTLAGVGDVPPEIIELVTDCLALDPERRPPASEVADRLAELRTAAPPRPRRAPVRHRVLIGVLAAVLLLAVGGLAQVGLGHLTAPRHDDRSSGQGGGEHNTTKATEDPGAADQAGTAEATSARSGTGPANPETQTGTSAAGTAEPLTVQQAMDHLRAVLDAAMADGTVQQATGYMLRTELLNMTANRTSDESAALRQIDNFRRKILDFTRSGDIKDSASRNLLGALDQLATATRSEL